MNPRQRNIFIILTAFLLIGLALNLALGSVYISFSDLFPAIFGLGKDDNIFEKIIWQLRMPRAAAAMLAGASLSLSGLLMQTFFRNPIAGPYVLGISSGAGLGAAVWLMGAGWLLGMGLIGSSDMFNAWGLVTASCIGAGLVLLLLLAVSWRISDIGTLLILGMMLGSAVGALVMLLQFFSGREELQRFVLWSMGDLGGLSVAELWVLGPLTLIGVTVAMLLAQPLNVLLLGEDNARSLGVSVKRLRWQLIITTAVLAGSITAFCGPIAFVGIAVPHAARLLWRTQRHQILILGTVLLGMVVMLYCQLIAILPFQDKVLPINVVTSLLGAPVVVWIVLSIRK